MLIFGIYILCLFQVVTFQDDTSWASNNFIPLKEILRYNNMSRLFIKNVLGNMIMFLPFGFFTSYYLKSEKIHLPFFLTLIASVSIEATQLIIGRVFDVDDIILNLLGGILGYYVYTVLRIISTKLPSFCRKDWFFRCNTFLSPSLQAVAGWGRLSPRCSRTPSWPRPVCAASPVRSSPQRHARHHAA